MPSCTPTAPSMNAAATPRPSPMPPAAMTGIVTALVTCGTSAMVVVSPIWPPLSPPSAMTAQAPTRCIRRAMLTDATTGMTLMPAASQSFIYLEGLPAPVVTTATFSSATSFATSSANGLISMMFTPKGLSVSSLAILICSRRYSAFAFIAEIMPRPPASETAPANLPSEIQAMPP